MKINKTITLIIIIISFLSCKERAENSVKKQKHIESKGINIQNKKYEKALEKNLKMIEQNPEIYFHYSQRGLLLELANNKKEAELYYTKGRKIFEQKEEYYWNKYDSISMALMLIEIGDSLRGRDLIDKISESKITRKISINELKKVRDRTHGELLNILESTFITDSLIKEEKNEGLKNIIEEVN